MDMCIDSARRQYQAFPRDDLGRRSYRDRDSGLHVRVAGLPDAPDAALFQPDIGFDDSPMVDDERVGDHRVRDGGADALALAHAVPDDLAAAKFHFLAIDRVVLLD